MSDSSTEALLLTS